MRAFRTDVLYFVRSVIGKDWYDIKKMEEARSIQMTYTQTGIVWKNDIMWGQLESSGEQEQNNLLVVHGVLQNFKNEKRYGQHGSALLSSKGKPWDINCMRRNIQTAD